MATSQSPAWAAGLSVAGLYYDGIVDENKLQEILELHKRDTVSTFGTRSSRRVSSNSKSVKTSCLTQSNKPNSEVGDMSGLDTVLSEKVQMVC